MSQQFPLERSRRAPEPYIAAPGQTDFPFTDWLYDAEDVEVRVRAVGNTSYNPPLVLGTDYEVLGLNDLDGATVRMLAGMAGGELVKLRGKRLAERRTSVTQGGNIKSIPLERELDLAVTVMQELRRDVDEMAAPPDDFLAAVERAENAAEAAETAAGAAAGVLATAVRFTPQALSAPQKAQALANLGAGATGAAILAAADPAAARAIIGESGSSGRVGLTLANVAGGNRWTHFTVKAGRTPSDAVAPTQMVLAADLTKRLDLLWTLGAGGGALDTGVIGNGTYYAWLIVRSDTSAADVIVSRSATGPAMPAPEWDIKQLLRPLYRVNGQVQGFAPFPDPSQEKGAPLKTRSVIMANEANADYVGRAPEIQPVNFYPHSVAAMPGAVFLTSVGGNGLGTGNAKVEKFHSITAEKLNEYSFGANPAFGANGLCIALGSVWVAVSTGTGTNGKVVRLNAETLAYEGEVITGNLCRDVWFDGVKIWSLSGTNGQTYRIDPVAMAIDLPVATAGTPFRGVATDTHVWVACFAANVVRKIDRDTGAVLASVPTAASPNWFEWDGQYLYVACYDGDAIQIVNTITNTVIATITISANSRPHGMKRVNDELWVACSGDHYIRIMNTVTRVFSKSRLVPENPPALCVAEDAVWHASGNTNVLLRHAIKTVWQ